MRRVNSFDREDERGRRQGDGKTVMVGLVGKPNVGKSTFFSAATMTPVPIANYPFTTIKPNRGVAYVRSPCVCKTLGVEDDPVNSACIKGTRLIPVQLIDCAGLVPGAWQGRGLGNQFLDEIRRADALIHIVDLSGGTDEEGRICELGTHDPIEDVRFLEYEISMWMLGILQKDWEKIARRAEGSRDGIIELIEDRFSGLSIDKHHFAEAVKRQDLDVEKPTDWTREELLSLISETRRTAKPMLISGNKVDLKEGEENYKKMKERDYPILPCSAEAELVLRRAADKGLVEYIPGDGEFKFSNDELTDEQRKALEVVKNRVLEKWGFTGVQQALNTAFFELLDMITVYPVEDVERLSDHKGRVLPDVYLVKKGTTAKELAYMIHSDLGDSFLSAIEARSKRRVGEDYTIKDQDILKIVATKARG
jgi:ribosome-binding ATPase YchF (GTP1/OBG family)